MEVPAAALAALIAARPPPPLILTRLQALGGRGLPAAGVAACLAARHGHTPLLAALLSAFPLDPAATVACGMCLACDPVQPPHALNSDGIPRPHEARCDLTLMQAAVYDASLESVKALVAAGVSVDSPCEVRTIRQDAAFAPPSLASRRRRAARR